MSTLGAHLADFWTLETICCWEETVFTFSPAHTCYLMYDTCCIAMEIFNAAQNTIRYFYPLLAEQFACKHPS